MKYSKGERECQIETSIVEALDAEAAAKAPTILELAEGGARAVAYPAGKDDLLLDESIFCDPMPVMYHDVKLLRNTCLQQALRFIHQESIQGQLTIEME